MNYKEYKIVNAPSSVYYIPDFISKTEEDLLLNKVYSAPKPKWTQLSHRKLQNWGGLPHVKGMVAEALPSWLQCYADKIGQLGIFEEKIPNHVLVNEYLPGQGIMPHEDGPLFYPTVSTISLGSHTMLDFYHPLNQEGIHQDSSPSSSVSHDSSGVLHDSCNVSHDGCMETVTPLEAEDTNCNLNSTVNSLEVEDTNCNQNSSFESRRLLSILLEPRSLVLVCDDMYKVYLHGISERETDVLSEKVANLSAISASGGDVLRRSRRVSLTFRFVPKLLKAKLIFGKK
ncbi:unnamed protein product [Lymnaea stagnalis]|uniref:Fe2OG dioxygenase domain-containing protein n=1 Tax=Lymnaea stagnalis TaxID=6523 RepID=A0AAV2HHL8_LYMST